jgi:hypothetical protein
VVLVLVLALIAAELAIPATAAWWTEHPMTSAFVTSGALLAGSYLVLDDIVRRREIASRVQHERHAALNAIIAAAGRVRSELSALMLTAGMRRDERGDLPADAIATFVSTVVGRDDRLERRLIELATLGSETLRSTVNAHRALLDGMPGERATIAGNPDLFLVDLFDFLHQHLGDVPVHIGERDVRATTFALESYESGVASLNRRLEREGIVRQPVNFGGNFYDW